MNAKHLILLACASASLFSVDAHAKDTAKQSDVIKFSAAGGPSAVLTQSKALKKPVEVTLIGGTRIHGVVADVNERFAVLNEVGGREFVDAMVRIDQIAAVEALVRHE